jgi:hypothetical protein
MTGVKIHDNGCALKVYRAEILRDVTLYGEMHRFIVPLASIEGATIKEVPVNHRARLHGTSKYNLTRTFKVVMDLITVLFMKRFFTRPLHMFGNVGLWFLLLGCAILGYMLVDKLIYHESIGTRPLLTFGTLLVVAGIQLLSTGLIAEIQVRTYYESQNKPIFRVRHIYQYPT